MTIEYTEAETKIIERAYRIIGKKWSGIAERDELSSPVASKGLIKLRLAAYTKREAFIVVFMDSQNARITDEVLFEGTIDGAAVYPRIVAQRCLEVGAAAVVFGHNHPSGIPEPSQADRRITDRLKDALALFDVRVLDHIIVGGDDTYSFAESGLL